MITNKKNNANANFAIRQILPISRTALHQSEQLADMALLAESAYADFSDCNSDLDIEKALTKKGGGTEFGEEQAKLVTDNWRVIAYWNDLNSRTDSSFSATLFQRKIGGQYVFAIEGTQETKDLLDADVTGIIMNGLAYKQIIDMYNFWQQINTVKGQTYQAAKLIDIDIYSLEEIKQIYDGLPNDPDGESTLREIQRALTRLQQKDDYIFDAQTLSLKKVCFMDSAEAYKDSPDKLNRIYGHELNPESVTVVGHSLGGHLSIAFSRLFPDTTDSVYIFNAVGFGDGIKVPNLQSDNLANIDNLFSALEGKASFDPHKIRNFVGNKNIDFIAQDGPFITQKSEKLHVYIESGVNGVLGHGVGQLTDSLAVLDLFHRLGIKSDTVEELLAISNPLLIAIEEHKFSSLGQVIKILAKIFYSQEDYDKEIDGVEMDRQKLYAAIVKLQAMIKETGNQFTNELIPLIGKGADSTDVLLDKITDYQDSAIGYRFAMVNLMPFAVIGPDYQQFNQQGLLNIYNPNEKNKPFGFTERYLKDRFEMIRMMWTRGTKHQYFHDVKTGVVAGAVTESDDAINYIFYPHEEEYVNEHNDINRQTTHLNIYGGSTTSMMNLSGTSGYVEQITHHPLTSTEINYLNIEQGDYEVFDPSTMLYLESEYVGFDLRKYSGSSGILGSYIFDMGYRYMLAFVTSGENDTVNIKIISPSSKASVTFKNVPYITCTVGDAQQWIGGPGKPMPFTFWFQNDTFDRNSTAYIPTRSCDSFASLLKNSSTEMHDHLTTTMNKEQEQSIEEVSVKGTNEDDVLTINAETATVAGLLGADTYVVTLEGGNRVTLVETGFNDYDKVILTNLAFTDATFAYTSSGLEICSTLGTVVLAAESLELFEELVFTDKTLYSEDIALLVAETIENYPSPQAAGKLKDLNIKPLTHFEWQLPDDCFIYTDLIPCYYLIFQNKLDPLPAWLTFDIQTKTLKGKVPQDAQSISVKVFAVSALGRMASQSFNLVVVNDNLGDRVIENSNSVNAIN